MKSKYILYIQAIKRVFFLIRGAKSRDMLVPQLRQILGRHKETTEAHTLVPADYFFGGTVLVGVRMLLRNLGPVQVRTSSHIHFETLQHAFISSSVCSRASIRKPIKL